MGVGSGCVGTSSRAVPLGECAAMSTVFDWACTHSGKRVSAARPLTSSFKAGGGVGWQRDTLSRTQGLPGTCPTCSTNLPWKAASPRTSIQLPLFPLRCGVGASTPTGPAFSYSHRSCLLLGRFSPFGNQACVLRNPFSPTSKPFMRTTEPPSDSV